MIKAMCLHARDRAHAAVGDKGRWREYFPQLPDFARLVHIGMLTEDCCSARGSEGYAALRDVIDHMGFLGLERMEMNELQALILTQALRAFAPVPPRLINFGRLCEVEVATVALRAQKRAGRLDAIKEEHMIRPKGRGSHDPRVAKWFRKVIKGVIKGWRGG